MKRTMGMMILATALGGCVSMETGSETGNGGHVGCNSGVPASVPGVQGPWGAPVLMTAPYSAAPPGSAAAHAMMSQSVPLSRIQATNSVPMGLSGEVVQAGAMMPAGMGSGIIQAGGTCPPGGCPATMGPPAGTLSPPGVPYAPLLPAMAPPPGSPPGAVAAANALTGQMPRRFATRRTEVRFVSPTGMKVSWFAPGPDGKAAVASTQLEVIGRYNFIQGSIYRLKLGDISNHPGLDLYPTLEVVPSNARSDPFLAHSAVPLAFTEDDFEQVLAGNYVVKVIYLPDPQFQGLGATGPDEVVSEPGIDPIAEAYRRGSILLVVRMGNIDLEAPNTPAMDAPNPYVPRPMMPPGMLHPGMQPGMGFPGPMVPYGIMGPGRPPMMAPNGTMMAPNGTMRMGPYGPVIGPANRPAAPAGPVSNATLQPGTVLPPSDPGQAVAQNRSSPAPANTSVSSGKTAAAPTVQQTQYPDVQGTVPASVQDAAESSTSDAAPARTRKPWRLRQWLFGPKSDDQ